MANMEKEQQKNYSLKAVKSVKGKFEIDQMTEYYKKLVKEMKK